CMQCGTCSGGCTNADLMDILPRNLVLMVQRGEWKKVLQSQALWLCTSCQICTSRCPRGVRPADVIEAVKAIAIQQGINNDSTRFNQIFVELIEKRGILFEPELMHKYGGISAMLKQAKLGAKLALRGKLSPLPAQVKEPQKFSQALAKVNQP
ncbi:4Fe-4S dicluster domain-containing protein, partial [Brunnivagina elsteri]